MLDLKIFRFQVFSWIVFFCLLLLCVPLSGCAGPPRIQQQPQERKVIAWPPPPQQARITFERDITFPRDIRTNTGFWSRFKELLLGKKLPVIVRPYGLTVDKDENLLIVDPGARKVHIYHLPDGNYRYLPHKKDNLVFLSPIDTDVDDDGRIYVSDSVAKQVYVFDRNKRYKATIGEFMRPTGLTVNKKLSRLYVVDTMAHRIRVYDTKEKKLLFDLGQRGGGPAEFNYPTNICLDDKGNVYVTDSMNFRIQVFDQDGAFLYSFGVAGDGPGTFSKPRGIGVDSEGHIYVADAEFDNVQILDSTGQLLLYFGTSGRQPGEFYLPAGLVIDSKDRIYVADSFNQRIQVFQYLKK